MEGRAFLTRMPWSSARPPAVPAFSGPGSRAGTERRKA